MLPLQTTKVGPGDKTKAYVVRQNTCLKILLFTFSFLVLILIILSSTLYDVHVERRSKAHDAGHHRREEHALRMQMGRLGMRLQEHMKDEMRDMSMLREYRARLYRAVGEYQNKVRASMDEATGRDKNVQQLLTRLELELDEQLELAMRQLWQDVNTEGKHAKERLTNLTRELVQSMKDETGEQTEFEQLYGEGTAYHEAAEQGLRGDDEDLDNYDDDPDYNDDDMEEMKLRYAVERLHTRLMQMPNISLAQAELNEWEATYNTALDALGDDTKEADLKRIQNSLRERLQSKGLGKDGGVDDEDDVYQSSVMDQFEAALEAAKVMPHKADLLQKYGQWQAGQLPTMQLVQHIEQLYEQGILETGLFDDWDD